MLCLLEMGVQALGSMWRSLIVLQPGRLTGMCECVFLAAGALAQRDVECSKAVGHFPCARS